MSVGKKKPTPSSTREDEAEGGGGGETTRGVERKESGSGKRYGRWFSGLDDVSVGVDQPLKETDAAKLKRQIRKWARAVVAYARQISFGSPRRMSSDGGGAAAGRSATFPSSKSSLGGGDQSPVKESPR